MPLGKSIATTGVADCNDAQGHGRCVIWQMASKSCAIKGIDNNITRFRLVVQPAGKSDHSIVRQHLLHRFAGGEGHRGARRDRNAARLQQSRKQHTRRHHCCLARKAQRLGAHQDIGQAEPQQHNALQLA